MAQYAIVSLYGTIDSVRGEEKAKREAMELRGYYYKVNFFEARRIRKKRRQLLDKLRNNGW